MRNIAVARFGEIGPFLKWHGGLHFAYPRYVMQERNRSVSKVILPATLLWLVACLLFGCAGPKDANVTAFANATTALTTLAKSTGDLNTDIDSKIKLAIAADQSIGGDTSIPAPKGVLITGKSDADWKSVVAFLDALSAYASALAQANNPGAKDSSSSDKKTSASSASANMATAKAAASSSKSRVQQIGSIVEAIITLASNLYAGIQIRETMTEMQPVLEKARIPLTTAIYNVYSSTQNKLFQYETILYCRATLLGGFPEGNIKACLKYFPNAVRQIIQAKQAVEDAERGKVNPLKPLLELEPTRVTILERYNNYVSISQEDAALKLQLSALKDVSKAVSAMIDAHAKLLQNIDDPSALTQFLQQVDKIAQSVSQAEKLQGVSQAAKSKK